MHNTSTRAQHASRQSEAQKAPAAEPTRSPQQPQHAQPFLARSRAESPPVDASWLEYAGYNVAGARATEIHGAGGWQVLQPQHAEQQQQQQQQVQSAIHFLRLNVQFSKASVSVAKKLTG